MPPLSAAVEGGYADIVQLLLENHADVNAKSNYCLTPLHYAAQKGHKEIAKLLLACGADANAKNTHANENGDTPLHLAAGEGHSDVIELLLASKAEVNARNSLRWTPLELALVSKQEAVVKLLRKHGALE